MAEASSSFQDFTDPGGQLARSRADVFGMPAETLRLKAGEVFRIPAREPRALKALRNFKMLLIK
ncbi:cupin domain-containing protein [Pontibacter kalidii]|uniref:hypothetical protein n=1 Tax=Pontibacter kalidii TaxID=2592049 RepID=UPI002259AF8B|nr:hypothetical protein [Pontibacter kalidii]